MQVKKLYRTLVLGGGVVIAGCASSQTSSNGGKNKATDAPPKPGDSPVVSSSTEERPSSDVARKQPQLGDPECEGCSLDKGAGAIICPDPNTGTQNCCWLMVGPKVHPCCQ